VKYFDLDTLVDCTDNLKLIALHHELMKMPEVLHAEGSSHNHQAWSGGYLTHITEVMNIGMRLWGDLTMLRPLPFTMSEALVVLYLHDLEKPFKTPGMTKQERRDFRDEMIRSHGIELTPEQWNALTYVEVEFDYTGSERKMKELACFCHVCDILSARLWHDRGAEGKW
jgi:hypothetical protein